MGQCWPKACDDCASITSSDLGLTDNDDEIHELIEELHLPYQILRRVESYGHLKVNNQVGDVFDHYHEVKVIGEGSMGSVSKVIRKMQKFDQSHKSSTFKSGTNQRSRQSAFTDLRGMENSGGYTLPLEKCEQTCLSKSRRIQRQIQSTNDLLGLATGDDIPSQLHHEYALKSINFEKINDPSVLKEMRNEIEILRDLDHPNIVKPIETYESPNQIYIGKLLPENRGYYFILNICYVYNYYSVRAPIWW